MASPVSSIEMVTSDGTNVRPLRVCWDGRDVRLLDLEQHAEKEPELEESKGSSWSNENSAHSSAMRHPHRSLRSYLSEFCGHPNAVIFVAFCATASVAVVVATADPDAPARELFRICTPECRLVPPWKAVVVANTLAFLVLTISQGWRSEHVLFASSLFLGLTGIITGPQAVHGFASPGNVALQGLLVIFSGIADSGVLDRIFGALLGFPKSRLAALFRVQALGALMSAVLFLGSTTFVGAPAVAEWAPLVRLSPREALIPFINMAVVAQSFLLISAIGLVVSEEVPSAQLRIWDTSLINFLLLLIVGFYGLLAATPLLRIPGPQETASSHEGSQRSSAVGEDRYIVAMAVLPVSLLLGKTPQEVGLLAVPGVEFLSGEKDARRPMAGGDVMYFAVTARGLVCLRRRAHGLELQGPHRTCPTINLGGRRHKRVLVEASVRSNSALVGRCVPPGWAGAVCIAARRPGSPPEVSGSEGASLQFRGPLQVGDVLIFEAFADFVLQPELHHDFSFVAEVPNSAPPRHGRQLDTQRGWLAVLLLFCVIALAMTKVVSLVLLAPSAAAICVMLNIVHPISALKPVNMRMALIFAGALGVFKGVQQSGLGAAVAQGILLAGGGSEWLVLVELSFVAMAFTQILPHTAVASMLTPVVTEVIQAFAAYGRPISPKAVCLSLIFASCASFASPFTLGNREIRELGPYEIADYMRMGIPLQVIFLLVAPTLCLHLA